MLSRLDVAHPKITWYYDTELSVYSVTHSGDVYLFKADVHARRVVEF